MDNWLKNSPIKKSYKRKKMLTIQTQGNGIADAAITFVEISVLWQMSRNGTPNKKKTGSKCLFKSISIIAYCSTKTSFWNFIRREMLCIKSSASMLKKPVFFFFACVLSNLALLSFIFCSQFLIFVLSTNTQERKIKFHFQWMTSSLQLMWTGSLSKNFIAEFQINLQSIFTRE